MTVLSEQHAVHCTPQRGSLVLTGRCCCAGEPKRTPATGSGVLPRAEVAAARKAGGNPLLTVRFAAHLCCCTNAVCLCLAPAALAEVVTTRVCVQVTDFPLFDAINAAHVEAGMAQVLGEAEAALDALEAGVRPTWEGLVDPLTRIQDRLDHTWGVVQHLLVRYLKLKT